jgi:hypothetical protein
MLGLFLEIAYALHSFMRNSLVWIFVAEIYEMLTSRLQARRSIILSVVLSLGLNMLAVVPSFDGPCMAARLLELIFGIIFGVA